MSFDLKNAAQQLYDDVKLCTGNRPGDAIGAPTATAFNEILNLAKQHHSSNAVLLALTSVTAATRYQDLLPALGQIRSAVQTP